jgi:hypothetical protein
MRVLVCAHAGAETKNMMAVANALTDCRFIIYSFGFPSWLPKIRSKVPIRFGNSSVGNSR